MVTTLRGAADRYQRLWRSPEYFSNNAWCTFPCQRARNMLPHRCVILLSVCAIGLIAAQGQQQEAKVLGTGQTVPDKLKANGFSLFLQMLSIAGISRPNPTAAFTIMAPTDEAVKTWLKQMNLTMAELEERPGLTAAVVAYHVIPRAKANKTTLQAVKPPPTKSNPTFGFTADGVYPLKFYFENGKVVVEDVQGNTAAVVKPDVDAGYSVIHGINKVMLSGDVYLTATDFLKIHPDFETMRMKLENTGLVKLLDLNNGVVTIFAPTDKAFQAADSYLGQLTQDQRRSILRYHIVPGEYTLPADFKPGQPYQTALKGHFFKLKYIPINNGNQTGLDVHIIPEAGLAGIQDPDGAHVSIANIFAKKLTIHGIDSVLLPNIGLPDLTSKAGPSRQGPHRATPQAKPQAKPAAHGRRLLQRFHRSNVGGQTINSVSMTNTQSQIRAAVEGRISAADAAQAGLRAQQFGAVRCFNCEIFGPGGAATPGG